ncbi:MAG: TonB-dependent receptor [Gillisia sp.]
MKTTVITIIILLGFSLNLHCQTIISGIVKDQKGNVIPGANVFIEGSYEGAITEENGTFSFITSARDSQTLVISYLSFQTKKITEDVTGFSNLTISLKEDLNSLDAVVITAGNFQAGEKARVSVLKPLDIVTTAGSVGDIVAALQTLPGTQIVGENGRLFVRGGDAGETRTFVDGIRVAQPYSASVQNVPARGRFSPFLFSGIMFSTGGFSAEYGEALSSVLLLNTSDVAVENNTEISLMSLGLVVGHTQKWEKSSLSLNSSYINLSPYHKLAPQNLEWEKPFESLSGEVIYQQQTGSGLLKIYGAYEATNFKLNRENFNESEPTPLHLKNKNLYLNTTYRHSLANNWEFFGGLSQGYSNNNISQDQIGLQNTENATHLKTTISKRFSPGIKLIAGAEYFHTHFMEDINNLHHSLFSGKFTAPIAAVFTEADILFSKNFAAKVGVRATYDRLLEENSISPRISLAYKTSKTSQFSAAFGNFSQSPGQDYLKYTEEISVEKASHFILNYQYNKERILFRVEAYYKEYNDLLKYDTPQPVYNSRFSNSGYGFARGLDVFWRDGSSFKNLEYWLSYSFIDTQRNYQNFPVAATPGFVASHTASLVTKYFITSLRSQVGFSYSYGSGRPYNNPNEILFMNGKTQNYNSLNFNWAYLISKQKILYFSISNVLGTKNIFGYEYSSNPEPSGFYSERAIIPAADRFFFVGLFWTINSNKNKNQLENL